nr:flagellin [uncultured Desulfobacter sp.]
MESTISNLSTTTINIDSSKSVIRDVDFAEESKVSAKMSVLVETSTYALSQADSMQERLLDLKDGLSPKEQETLSYLPLGYSNRQIGLAMNIAEVTVKKTHEKRLRQTCGLGQNRNAFQGITPKRIF